MLTGAIHRSAFFKSATDVTLPGPHMLEGPIDLIGVPMSFVRNGEIYGESEPADYLYKVVRGTVRTYKLLNDGRRQIGGFYGAGDIFGLETGEMHSFSAEAITDCRALMIKRSTLMALAERDHEVARELWAVTGRELRRGQDHLMLLVKSAQERVAAFLLEMAKQVSGGKVVQLPMPRQDIADYLGITIETVSRTLTLLEHAATIELSSSREIILHDRSALSRLNA